MGDKLLLFDGNALLHRAYHALPPLTSTDGKQIGAIYGMVSILLAMLEKFMPTHLAFAFDTKEPTFRNELLPTYQAQRAPADDALIEQFSVARDVCRLANICYFEKNGYEADDLIGTIANRFSGQVYIVTGDRDLLQLVNHKVKLIMPTKINSEVKIFGENEVVEKMGVGPGEIVLYKALVGDASDNYFGVSGIGPKTAISLIEKYKSLDQIYNNLEEISSSVSQKLMLGKESAYMSLQLAKVKTDVDIEFSETNLDKWDIGSEQFIEGLKSLGMKTLPRRAEIVSQKIKNEKQISIWQ